MAADELLQQYARDFNCLADNDRKTRQRALQKLSAHVNAPEAMYAAQFPSESAVHCSRRRATPDGSRPTNTRAQPSSTRAPAKSAAPPRPPGIADRSRRASSLEVRGRGLMQVLLNQRGQRHW